MDSRATINLGSLPIVVYSIQRSLPIIVYTEYDRTASERFRSDGLRKCQIILLLLKVKQTVLEPDPL